MILIAVAFIGAIPATIGACAAWKGMRHARNTDDAVNHRGPDEPRLVDIVKDIREEQLEQSQRLTVLETAFLHHMVVDHDRRVGG